jgi:sorbitol/mannitol transport system permease protein
MTTQTVRPPQDTRPAASMPVVKPRRRRRSLASHGRGAVITAITWVIVVLFFFPVAWMVFTAFKTEGAAATSPPVFITPLSFDNFVAVFNRDIGPYLVNSIIASVASTLVVLVLAVPAAYALSIRPIKKVQDALFFFISTRFMPVAAGIIPIYLVLKSLGALDNITALSLLYVGINLPIAVWMMRSFFSEVPIEIVEASQIDGANFRIELTRVVLPIVAPGIAAVALICFIFAWNEYFLANLLTASAARTTPPFLGSFVDGRGQFLAVLSAASTIAVLPVVAAGWIAQKQLVRGLAMGAIK